MFLYKVFCYKICLCNFFDVELPIFVRLRMITLALKTGQITRAGVILTLNVKKQTFNDLAYVTHRHYNS